MILTINGIETQIPVNDTSYRRREIMGENSLTLTFSLPGYMDIPIGTTCTFQGETYTMTDPAAIKKIHTRNFEFNLVLNSPGSNLEKYKIRDIQSGRLKFTMTAKPQEFLQVIIDNLNTRETGWVAGDFLVAAEKTVAFNHNTIAEALKAIAEAFITEFEISGKTISLNKVEYNKNTPLALSYGKGNGFKSGIGRSNSDTTKPADILFVQGGERNIDPTAYGSAELMLPTGQSYTYQNRTYQADQTGKSIHRTDVPATGNNEASIDLSNIYPKRVGEVTALITVDSSNNFYDFTDQSIPEALDYKTCLIEGETMTVIFETGMLAGRELETAYDHTLRKFAIVPQAIDGVTMPNDTYKPAPGDQYAVFGIQLPTAYIRDDQTQTGASWELFKEGAKHLFENENPRFSFVGEVDGIWAKQNWQTIGAKIKPGGYVSFSDLQFQTIPVLIRISAVKDLINNPYKPTVELSTVTAKATVSSDLAKIQTNEAKSDQALKDAIQYTKRRIGAIPPEVVFSGEYSPAKTYTGQEKKTEVVRYNGVFYKTRSDAGKVTNKLPTNAAFWDEIGTQYDIIATNLLLAEQAVIADWQIKGGKITSQNFLPDGTTPKAQLDGENGAISLNSQIETYTPTGQPITKTQTIQLSSDQGKIQASASDNSVAYISSQGIFSNKAGIQAVPASTGIEIKAAVVGLGFGELKADAYSANNAICGVYGDAQNNEATNPAPSWGGIFRKLLANGLYMAVRQITTDIYLTAFDAYITCYNTAAIGVYLPPTPQLGQTIIIKMMNAIAPTVYGNGFNIFYYASAPSHPVGVDLGDAGVFVFDGQFWIYQVLYA